MVTLNTGVMPNTDFRFEEFEGMLGSFYLTFKPLDESDDPADQADYAKALEVLTGFAERYNLQKPEDVVNNPRSSEDWAQPRSFRSNFSLTDMMGSFHRDYALCREEGIDLTERNVLGQTILRVLERHDIATIGYDEHDGEQIPVRIQKWNNQYQFMTLADVINQK